MSDGIRTWFRQMTQKSMLWARVDVEVRDVVKRLAEAKGISISEYVRSLVLEDLDKRTVFTTILKKGGLHLSSDPEKKGEKI